MRLFIATPTHYLHGGVERILESLARHLPPRGFDVRFGLAKGARFHDPDRFRAAFPDVRGVDVDGTSGTAYGRRRALRKAMLDADPDIVLIARMFDAYPVASELKLRGHRLRLAVTVQAYESDYFVDLARYGDFVDVVVTSGELIAAAVREFTSVPHVVSVPGGVRPPWSGGLLARRGDGLRARRSRGNDEESLSIGYVGRIEQLQKRVFDLPLLAKELERRGVPVEIVVAGAGTVESELRAQLPQAQFLGWVSTEELYDRVYPSLDVFVHFAEWEGMTIAPREAMVNGVVPVVSRFIGAEDFVDGVNALTFDVGDIGGAADAIERLHRDRALLERLSANARTSQSGIRSEEGATDAWAQAFREAVARPARIGSKLPPAPRDTGLLTRLHVPEPIAELVRRVRKREHGDPGSEWPHWSGIEDQELTAAVMAFARSAKFSNEK